MARLQGYLLPASCLVQKVSESGQKVVKGIMSGKEKVSKKKKVAKVATFMSGMVHREKISLHINLLF